MSKFFLEREVLNKDNVFCDSKNKNMSLDEYSKSKNVKNIGSLDSDRSICQMLRNVNGLTSYNNHKDIVLLVNFANNAVIKLGSYSRNPGNRWGGRKTRSDFCEDKRKMGLFYLSLPHHSSFECLKRIYNNTNDERVRDYVIEVSYYMERINSKILEYENNGSSTK